VAEALAQLLGAAGDGDAVGWTYRKDWFAKPELRQEFKTKYGHELAPPKDLDEFMQVAKFFQNRVIDGKKVYGAYIFTERGSKYHHGCDQRHVRLRLRLRQPEKPYEMNGFVNAPGAVKGLELYKEIFKCCTAPA